MKTLILLRHAKAVSKEAASDAERALSPRGREDAAAMAGVLQAGAPRPDRALVSTARRTRETWMLAGAEWSDVPVLYEDRIYEATTGTLLKLVNALDEPAGCVIMVGHNPGFEELALGLAEPSSGAERAALAGGMPTAAAAILAFDVASWREVDAGRGRLAAFLTGER